MDDVGQTLLNWASAFGTQEMVSFGVIIYKIRLIPVYKIRFVYDLLVVENSYYNSLSRINSIHEIYIFW